MPIHQLCRFISVLLIGCSLFTACTAPKTTAPPSVPPLASQPNANSDIGKTDARGIVITTDTPDAPLCHPAYYQVKKEVFETCLVDGMTFVQVSNAIGYEGVLVSQSGNTEIMRWQAGADNERMIIGTFRDGKLVSKSQVGLD